MRRRNDSCCFDEMSIVGGSQPSCSMPERSDAIQLSSERCRTMRIHAVLFVTTVLLAGCSTTIYVRGDEAPDNDNVFNYDQVNERLEDAPATIVCVDGTTYASNGMFITSDTPSFDETGSDVRLVLPTRDLARIEYRDYGRGAFTGAMVGVLSAIGGSIGMLWFGGNSEDVRLVAAGLFFYSVPLGTLVGAAAGAVVGSTQVLLFRNGRGERSEAVASPVSTLPEKISKKLEFTDK